MDVLDDILSIVFSIIGSGGIPGSPAEIIRRFPEEARMFVRPVYTLHRRHWLPLTLHETFEFFERPRNLPLITPPRLGFRILTPEPIAMTRGLLIDYQVRVLGIPNHWRSLISEYDPPHAFRDVQVIGPYRLWDHRHRFWRDNGGTAIEDFVVYEPPFGPIGALMNWLVIERQLREIFDYRHRRIEELLLGGAARARPEAGVVPGAA
jgi:ligand-binding SRPBCC domain-containing protein